MVSANDEIESEDTHLLDFKLVSNLFAFALGSIRRRKLLVASLALGILAATVSSLFLLPKTYHVETKLLIQRNQALSLRGESQNDAPTRVASETVMRRDNLIAIIHQTDLLHQWYNRRAPLAHLKDILVHAVSKAETEPETIEWMVEVLEKRMSVWTNEGVVSIGIDWPDPTMALRLVDAAEQNSVDKKNIMTSPFNICTKFTCYIVRIDS